MQTTDEAQLRDAEIERYDALDPSPGRDLQALVELLARICEVPYAVINMITSTEQHQVVAVGIDPAVCTREDSMCASVLTTPQPVVVSDASLDERFKDNPFVTAPVGGVRFYASAPIVTSDGLPLGRLCIFDTEPRELSPLQLDSLRTLADQVMDLLELRFRSRALEASLHELTQVRDELRRSNEQLALFAGQVSHDLRTPLTAILANAEMLSMEPAVASDEELAAMVASVDRAAERMNSMIEDILAFAREGGSVQLVDTDLASVFSLVLDDLAPLVQQSGARVHVGDLPRVLADSDMIYSVALNLMTNALKFVRPGTQPEVEVSSEQIDHRWRVRVRDHGIGIAPDRREAMFALFKRGESSAEGHGIGLSTARRLVEAHGGRIGIDSPDDGVGTVVWFDLPA